MYLNLQAMRGLAAVMVVMFHALGMAQAYGLDAGVLKRTGEWGSSGVDVFFVLSGVVLTLSVDKSMPDAWSFFIARCRRVVPLYATLTLLMVLLPMVVPSLLRGQVPSWGHALASLAFLSQVLHGQMPVLYVGWSLEYEMLFYAVMSLCLLTRNAHLVAWGSGVVLCAAVAFGLPNLVLEFLLGVLVARTLSWGGRAWGVALTLSGAACWLASMGMGFDVDAWRVVVWGMPAAALLAGLMRLPQIRPGAWVALGEASYSIYLIQVFALPAIFKVLQRWMPGAPADPVTILAVLLTACSGFVLHVGLEKPLARLSTPASRGSARELAR